MSELLEKVTVEPPLLERECGHPNCKDAGTYIVSALCYNCTTRYRLKLTRGHEVPLLGVKCDYCGCDKVKAS